MMKICVVGLGHVGLVTAAGFAKIGHCVTAVECDKAKLKLLQSRKCYLAENGLEELLASGVKRGNLTFTDELDFGSKVFYICVGTPGANGRLDHSCLRTVLDSIYANSQLGGSKKMAVIRSTANPQNLRFIEKELCEKYSLANVCIAVNPEFLREATAINDFFHPPFTIVGGGDYETQKVVLSTYEKIRSKKYSVSIEAAAILKLSCNAFHATKIAFANEIGSLCDAHGVNANELMTIFSEDTKLNCSSSYLKPGFAFGGSCLSKDLEELSELGQTNGLNILLRAVLKSNESLINFVCKKIGFSDIKSIALFGVTFKKGTNDLRDSPYIKLAKNLSSMGISVNIFDEDYTGELTNIVDAIENNPTDGKVQLFFDPIEALDAANAAVIVKSFPKLVDVLDQAKIRRIAIFDIGRILDYSSNSESASQLHSEMSV